MKRGKERREGRSIWNSSYVAQLMYGFDFAKMASLGSLLKPISVHRHRTHSHHTPTPTLTHTDRHMCLCTPTHQPPKWAVKFRKPAKFATCNTHPVAKGCSCSCVWKWGCGVGVGGHPTVLSAVRKGCHKHANFTRQAPGSGKLF